MCIHIFSLRNSETTFVLHLRTPHMLKAEQSSHLLLMVLLQQKKYAEYRISLHTGMVSSQSSS